MQKAAALYRQHVIKLEQNAERQWRTSLSPPGDPDRGCER